MNFEGAKQILLFFHLTARLLYHSSFPEIEEQTMLIKSVSLRNIRSYENQTIVFPPGSLLLSGDIGAGKSTILLAIEFALFGMRRTDLTGSALLRHGSQKGEVELAFSLDGREITIKRILKRGKDDIKQEAGYIIINGIKKEGTHVELKAIVLDLLGYPKDLLAMSRDLLFRYTVYTPQEAMKQIITEEKETRLNTLRKVFNIDRYKRVSENTAIVLASLREKGKLYEGSSRDLSEKQLLLEERKEQIEKLLEDYNAFLPKWDVMQQFLKEKQSSVKEKAAVIRKFQELKSSFALTEVSLQNKKEHGERILQDQKRTQEDLEHINHELALSPAGEAGQLRALVVEKEQEARAKQQAIIDISRSIAACETQHSQSRLLAAKISSLGKCPVCLQQVEEHHKEHIRKAEEEKIGTVSTLLEKHRHEEENLKKRSQALDQELKELRKKESDAKAMNVKKNIRSEKQQRLALLESEKSRCAQSIELLQKEKDRLTKEVEAGKHLEAEYQLLRQEFDVLIQEERSLAMQKRAMEVQREEAQKAVHLLEQEVLRKKQDQQNLKSIQNWQQWLQEFFIPLMGTLEKHVLFSVYHEFSQLFEEWFQLLIEDESLSVSLDREFTPTIEQNGYESFIENLSGGEKTAVALAYRLALNRVINDVVQDIKTKELIILDEPTDGFSSEQLDRMKVVLDQLNMKQVILVSHESKIESFVQHVVRVQKEGHVSEVVG